MDAAALLAAVADMSRGATQDFAVPQLLRQLCEAAARVLPVDGAGVMSRSPERTVFVHAAGAASSHIAPLERLQEAMQAGPCADSIALHAPVVAADLASDGRWVQFQDLAADLHLGAMVAVPLLSRGRGWGVLDLYRHTPGPWTAAELAAAQTLADLAVSYLVMAHDRDSAREAQQALAHRTMHDDLTGLPNRALLFDRLDHALATSARRAAGVAVVFLDIDLFKNINDTFGHTAGDRVLTEVADRLHATLRKGDTLARFAGDEFVIVCEGLPQGTAADLSHRVGALTDRLQNALRTPVRVAQVDLVVSASIGVAITRDHLTGLELLVEADTAMYAAKQGGRGRVSIRDHVTPSAVGYARQLERDLVGALDRHELRVYYQPIVHAGTHELVAVEALLRWYQPADGILPAGAFIDIAVKTGLIVGIGRWVIDSVCQQLAAWQRDLPHGLAPTQVYVNLSSPELRDDTLPDTIAGALARHGLLPHHLGLEIVEQDLADPGALAQLQQLHELGHPLSIDDFGTGYSSLARLLDLPVTMAKIDKAFVAGLPDHIRGARFVNGVLYLADTLDVHVIAEGVETAEQAEHLTRAGCHLLQGHHVSPPLPPDELNALWSPSSSS